MFLAFLAIVELLDFFIGLPKVRLLFSSTYIIYFILLSIEVYRQIIHAKDVDFGMISAVLCGFIILGLAGGSVFSIIEFMHPNSFNNLADGSYNVNYHEFARTLGKSLAEYQVSFLT